ncbi:hypothetical protein KCA1_0861 [Lactiplantibacillus pentosus KCA1]|nr:hypothetical protein KCA1_0861 [Lactiplantibacillus pentosus KCA1]
MQPTFNVFSEDGPNYLSKKHSVCSSYDAYDGSALQFLSAVWNRRLLLVTIFHSSFSRGITDGTTRHGVTSSCLKLRIHSYLLAIKLYSQKLAYLSVKLSN